MAKSVILVSLAAAGLLAKRYRPIPDIEADIEKAQAVLSTFKRERKRALASIKAKRQHKDPDYIAKFRAGRAAVYDDPERRAAWQAKIHDSCYAKGWYLPPMDAEQKRAYHRLLRKGVQRAEALQVAIGARPVVSQAYVSP